MTNFDLVKERVDIVSYIQRNVSLKKAGNVYKASCPFHGEKTPSFIVNPKTQQWKCFGACGVGGSIIDFAMKYHGMTEAEALQDVARFGNIQLEPLSAAAKERQDKRERLYALLQDAAEMFNRNLFFVEGEAARKYLHYKRGIDHDTMTDFLIGYASHTEAQLMHLEYLKYTKRELVASGLFGENENKTLYARFRNRITFPIFDLKGRVVGFTARAMGEDQPKYLNSPECDVFHKSDNLYGISRFEQGRRDFRAIKVKTIVEGCVDVISAHMRGFKGMYAPLGTALADEQIDLLCMGETEKLVFCLDNDKAGEAALLRLVEKHIHRAADKGVELYAMAAPFGKDADDTLREHPEMWQAAVDAARPVVEVLIKRELAKLGDQPTGVEKSNLARQLLPILKSDDLFIQQENIATLARFTGVSVDGLEAWLISQSKIRVMPKPAPDAPQEPSLETSILWGIIFNQHEGWLQRANAALICLSPLDTPLLYAFAPLSALDFTYEPYQQIMTLIANDLDSLEKQVIDTPLYDVYRRVMFDPPITSMFKADMPVESPRETMEEFIDNALLLRLNRLKADLKARKQFGEVMRGMALIQQKRESMNLGIR